MHSPSADAARLPYKRNLITLCALQSLSTTGAVVLATVNGLAGLAIAPHRSLATLPVASFIVGGALSTYFGSVLMARLGRRIGFQLGALIAMLGAGVCAYAVYAKLFWLLCVGSLMYGVYSAFSQYHRFAAAEAAPLELRSRAISWVLAGGIVGAVAGPESSKFTKDMMGAEFVGSYLSLVALAAVALMLNFLLALPPVAQPAKSAQPVGALALLRRLDIGLAVVSAVFGYAVMVFLMTATPLAMDEHHHVYADTAVVIEWHVLGMYAPSFVTGSLIKRFGVLKVILTGTSMMLLCAAVNFSGITFAHFWLALVLLGVGWNFMFIGGTTLLTEACSDDEKTVAQGTNEILLHSSNAAASLTAGVFLHHVGRQAMNLIALPFLLVVIALSTALVRSRRVQPS